MKDYPFDIQKLTNFSCSDPYQAIDSEYKELYKQLVELQISLNFPAIHADVGCLIDFLLPLLKPKVVFEMGSGYGHSAFWFLLHSSIDKIILTEKRDDLKDKFESLIWPDRWKDKIFYHQQDAFLVLESLEEKIDLVLIDGVKADYLAFLEQSYDKLNIGAHVFIDNSYWRGSFLDTEVVKVKKSAQSISKLHEYIKLTDKWQGVFIPFIDGFTLLRKC